MLSSASVATGLKAALSKSRAKDVLGATGAAAVSASADPASESPRPLLALLWMSGALVSFLAMGVAGRELSVELAPHHMAFYRNAICLLILAPIVYFSAGQIWRTAHLTRHAIRNAVHFFAQWCWLFGVGVLPLAEVFAIEFTVPLWTAILAAIFLRERLTGWRLVAIGLGFIGVLVLLRPGVAIVDPASFVVLAAAIGYSIAYVLTKHLVGTDSALTVVWWMNVVQLIIGGALSIGNLVWPSVSLWPWVLLIGLVGLSSHYCVSRALAYADATVVVPLDFLRLPLGAAVGFALYGEAVGVALLIGAALILAGNWINLRRG
ncbi:MAG: DMT family transporter [Pseudomonadota bacterium]